MFVTFEGPEGAGKSTALASVADRLRSEGRTVVTTREPGAGLLGEQIRAILLHGEDICAETELLLFLADRSNHVATLVRPALESGAVVLCDRYADSTLVYQGFARGLDEQFVRMGNEFATRRLHPDLTILFDLPVEIGLARLTNRDRLDAQPLEFHHRVREGFLNLARSEPSRWIVLDATQPPDKLSDLATEHVVRRLPVR
jgi:dTMP kinase